MAPAAHVKTLFIVQVLPIQAILMKTMPDGDELFAATEGEEGKDAEIAFPKEKPVDTNETGDMHVGGFSPHAAPAPVVESIAPSVSYALLRQLSTLRLRLQWTLHLHMSLSSFPWRQ